MSGSRKSLKNAALNFNPAASNSWSKDDSKFGQRMLEKMGWKKGEGIGLHGQGTAENIKLRWKIDNKGLGFRIKEDEWVSVEADFSKLLSQLNQTGERKTSAAPSLELTSVSSRSRVHYHKFIRGKDISRYSKQDLSGILGRKECDDYDVKRVNGTSNIVYSESENEVADTSVDPVLSRHSDDDSFTKKKSKKKLNNNEIDAAPEKIVASLQNDENFISVSEKLGRNVDEISIIDAEHDEMEERVQSVPPVEIIPIKKSKKVKIHPDRSLDTTDCAEKSSKYVAQCQNIDEIKTKNESSKNIDSINVDEEKQLNNSKFENDYENKSKKKKKRKTKLVEDCNPVICIGEDEFEISETSLKRKHKKINARKFDSVICLTDDENEIILSETEEKDFKKERRKDKTKKDSKVICIDDDDCDELEPQIIQNFSSTIKPKKRKFNDVSHCTEIDQCEESVSEIEFKNSTTKQNKKKKKVEVNTEEIYGIEDDERENAPVTIESKRVKKKKKSVSNPKDSNISSMPCENVAVKLKKKVEDLLLQSVSIKNELADETVSDQSVCNDKKKKEKGADCDAFSNVDNVIKEFEESKEKLLNQYRQNYMRKYLGSVNENDIRIYCDLDGHELDCKKDDDMNDSVQENKFEENPGEKFVERVQQKRLSKAERIIEKARLLKKIQSKDFVHNFQGSNLSNIAGYGNENAKS